MKYDLISREDVLDALNKLHGVGGIYLWDPEKVLAIIEKAPAVEAEPVVRGHWISVECGTLCSHCHRVFDHHFEVNHHRCVEFKRCPVCGAHMDEEVSE